MNNYNIQCFVMEPSENLKLTIIKLITDYKFIVDRGWENGYHLKLRGALEKNMLDKFVDELEKGVSDSLIDFDENNFILEYQSVAKILKRSDSLEPIFKGMVIVTKENSIFTEIIEDELFRKSNHILDSYYCENYFNDNSLYKVIQEVMKFHKSLESFETPGSTDAYNCHLSHYIAFINRIDNQDDKESIEQSFKLKYEKDKEEGLFNFDFTPTALTKELMNFYFKIVPLVKSEQLNFHMPFSEEQVDEKLDSASQRHQVTFAKENRGYYLHNDVLIANRWMTNALYKKLLLLGLSNMDRFYMNYVVSRMTYPEKELHDYPVELSVTTDSST